MISERVIQPLKLAYKAKAWYLKAFCTKRQDFRLFKLNRILDLEILEERFERRTFPGQIGNSEGDDHPIVLRFPKEMAYRVYDEFDRSQVQRQADGSLVVSAKIPQDAWLTGFILSFGTQVEILEPAELRKVIAEQARMIYEKNS